MNLRGRLRIVGAFVAALFRSLGRDRTALFFMVVLPIIVIVVVGTAFGGPSRIEVGAVLDGDGPTAAALLDELDDTDGLVLHRYDAVGDAEAAIRRNEISAAVVVPARFEEQATGAGSVELGFLTRPADPEAFTARVAIGGAVDAVAARVGAARVVVADVGGSWADVFARTEATGGGPAVEVVDVGGGSTRELSRFSLVAPQNLVLFVFITSLSAGAYLVTVRNAGILRRVASMAPTTTEVVVGLAAGWFAMALCQSALILVIGAVAFDVSWGDPLAATLLTVVFAAVGASAGLLVGALGRDQDKVGAMAPIVGIVLGALGGCMVPLEVFPPPMLAIAHLVPHYWAVVGWQALVFDGGGVGSIAASLVVLAGFAGVLLALAARTLGRQVAQR